MGPYNTWRFLADCWEYYEKTERGTYGLFVSWMGDSPMYTPYFQGTGWYCCGDGLNDGEWFKLAADTEDEAKAVAISLFKMR